MTKFSLMIKAATAALLLSGGAALANQDYCPITGQWQDPGTPCVANPPSDVDTPEEWNVWNNNLTQTINNNLASVGVGVGQGGNATGGNSASDSTSSSNSNATGGSSSATGGSSTSNSNATGGAGGSSTSNATGGSGGSSVATNGNQTTNVDASSRTTIRQAANAVSVAGATATAHPCAVGGGFGGSTIGQTIGGNVTALDKACANKVQDNITIDQVCTYLTKAECRAAIAYLDPTARAGMIAAGTIRERVPGAVVSVSRHEQGDGSFTRAMNNAVMQPTGRVSCPASHPVYVSGKGCRK